MPSLFLARAACLLIAATTTAAAQDLKVITWNIGGAERDADAVAMSAAAMLDEVGPADILILQEIIASAQVEAIADATGLGHWVISDFSPPEDVTNNPFASLEVAILSDTPIVSAAEWDITGPAANGDNFPPRPSSMSVLTEELAIGIDLNTAPARGFLRASIESGPVVYAVHWKSSRGQSCNAEDLGYARQREDQAHGLASDALTFVDDGQTVIIGGDFNIQAPGRALRVGTGRQEDCMPTGSCEGVCGAGGLDGYDDSLSVLLGLPGAQILSDELGPTFIGFDGDTGAIDHLIVAGANAAAFDKASAPTVTGDAFHGSDHRPVVAGAEAGLGSRHNSSSN